MTTYTLYDRNGDYIGKCGSKDNSTTPYVIETDVEFSRYDKKKKKVVKVSAPNTNQLPIMKDGVWMDLPPIDHWVSVKIKRDRLLTASDWVVTKSLESGEPISSKWIDYRQALRDITKQTDPLNIAWPTIE